MIYFNNVIWMLFDGILFVFWCSFIFLCSAHVLLSCPLCIMEDVRNLEFMVCWPPAVLIVAHGFHVQYVDEVGDVRKECGHVLSSLIFFIWFYFDFYLFWFYHDFIYILSFFHPIFIHSMLQMWSRPVTRKTSPGIWAVITWNARSVLTTCAMA